MPLFFTRKEVFEWLKMGKKTIEIRKGNPRKGEFAVFQAGKNILRLRIIGRQMGSLPEVLRLDNYKLVVPSAETLADAFVYLRMIYDNCDGAFVAYYVEQVYPICSQTGQ